MSLVVPICAYWARVRVERVCGLGALRVESALRVGLFLRRAHVTCVAVKAPTPQRRFNLQRAQPVQVARLHA